MNRSPSQLRHDQLQAAIWATLFIVLQVGFQLGMLVEAIGSLRVVMRSASFAVSMLFLFVVPGREARHPAKPWVIGALVLVALSIFHPSTNTSIAGIAHFSLYLAIAAPIFWACRLELTEKAFRYIVLGMWLFHTASAGLGVLQMHYPGRFQPAMSTYVVGLGEIADSFKLQLADGTTVWRPMGLTDTPGGAAAAGLYAIVFGLGIFLQYRTGPLRLLSIGGMALGLFCVYISQVRSLLVMAAICTSCVIALLVRRGEMKKYMELGFVIPAVSVAAFLWASQIGGDATSKRVESLVEDRADKLYAKNRGMFLMETLEKSTEYPLGAGLARYGMMRGYFGDESNLASPLIYVEIQFTAWLLDGGILLIFVYSIAVLVTAKTNLRIALSNRPGRLAYWGMLLFSLNIASIAVLFNYPLFMGQGGLEFWFLNACLFMAVITADRAARQKRLASPRSSGRGREASRRQPALAAASGRSG